jgi:hypothetical protein
MSHFVVQNNKENIKSDNTALYLDYNIKSPKIVFTVYRKREINYKTGHGTNQNIKNLFHEIQKL